MALDDDALDEVAGGRFAPHQSFFRSLMFIGIDSQAQPQPPAALPCTRQATERAATATPSAA